MKLIFTFIALIVGFVGGIFYSSYKTEPLTAMVTPDNNPEHTIPAEHARQIQEMEKKVSESPEDVAALEKATINVWSKHPDYFEIKAEADPEVKYQHLLETLLRIIRVPK